MPDLLAHAFLAYAVLRALSWRYDWLRTLCVTAGMAGAFIPDIMKVQLLPPSATVGATLGIPLAWAPIHRPGGTAICILIGAVLVDNAKRRQTLLVLSLGATSHLLADALLTKASGRSFPILWPFTRWRPPTPGLYLSTHPEPTIVTGVFVALVWSLSRWRARTTQVADR